MRRQVENIQPLREASNQYINSRHEKKWTNPHDLTIPCVNDLPHLAKLRNIIHSLRQDWTSLFDVNVKIQFKQSYQKRIILAESEIQAIFKRRIHNSGQFIDYSNLHQYQKSLQIVKYIPQVTVIEQFYKSSIQKQRRQAFNLKIMVKGLLQQLQRIKNITGAIVELDQGLLGMMRTQINDIKIDDILRGYRVNSKIIQVQKIVQKIVERVVEVPKVITVQKIVQKIVEIQKIKEVDKIVHVPIQTPKLYETTTQKIVPIQNRVQLIVQVPTIVQKIVQIKKQVPKIVEIQTFKDRIVEVDKPIEVQRVVNHIQMQIQPIQVYHEKIVPVETIIQKILQVPVYVQKIVEKVIQIPKIIQVQKIIQKIVPVIQYRSAREVQNHIEIKYQIVQRIVQKLVPVIQYRQKIVQVPKIIQVIKQVTNTITQIRQVEVIREKIVPQQIIKQVPIVQTKIIEVTKQIIKQIQRYIEVPVIKQVLVTKQLIVQRPIIQRLQTIHIKQVIIQQPLIIRQPTIVQVQKFINVYIEVPKPIKYIQQKIVQVPTIITRIKQVPTIVQKIIQKLIQVPKVIQVQKIVQKIIVVPRVVERIIQVPQIIQKIVEKQVIIEKIVQVQKLIQKPVVKQVLKQAQKIRNVYIQIQKAIQTVVQKPIQVPRIQQKIKAIQLIREVPITVVNQIPVEIQSQKIVHVNIQQAVPVYVQKQIIVPVQIPVPVEVYQQKIIPKQEIIQRIIPHPQIIQKIVPVYEQVTQLRQIQKIVEKIVVEKQIKQIQKIIPYINQVIKQVPTMIQKIVTVQSKIQEIVTAERIIQKVIQKTINIPQIYQVERIKQKLVQVPKLIQIQRIVPQIIKVNQYINKIVQKIIQVPTIIQSMREIVKQNEKIIPVRTETTQIIQVQRYVQKLVYAQKLKQVVRNVNYIEKVLQIVERLEQIPVTVNVTQQKFIEVPFILQKIVQKIIIMPQIVEVLKYVHEITQVDTNTGINIENMQQTKYKQLTKNIQTKLQQLLQQLKYLKTDSASKNRIQTIQQFLIQLKTFIHTPKIFKLNQHLHDQRSIKMQLSLSILTQKLILQLKRIKQNNRINIQLDDQIKILFFNEYKSGTKVQNQLQSKLQQYSHHIYKQFQSLGGFTLDHQVLLNGFIQERFLMAELIQKANLQLEEKTNSSQTRLIVANQLHSYIQKISTIIKENKPVHEIVNVISQFQSYSRTSTLFSASFNINKQLQYKLNLAANNQEYIHILKSQVDNLINQNKLLFSKISQNALLQSYRNQINDLRGRNLQLQTQISRLKSQNFNLINEQSLILQNISFKRDPGLLIHQAASVHSQISDLSGSRASVKSITQPFKKIQTTNKQNISTAQAQRFQKSQPRPPQSSINRNTPQSVSQFQSNIQSSPLSSSNRNQYFPIQTSQFNQTQNNQSSSSVISSQNVMPSQSSISGIPQYGISNIQPQSQLSTSNNINQAINRNFGVEDSQNIRSGYQGYSSSISSQLYRPTDYRENQKISTSNINIRQEQPITNLSKQEEQIRKLQQTSQQSYSYLGQIQQNISRPYNIGVSTQRQTNQLQHSNIIPSTPIESYKYNSPSGSNVKMTQSILKQEQSLSKFSAQSPQVLKKQQQVQKQQKYGGGFGDKK